jgi:protocatechuate 3,4-dioxygenase beta subunit
MPKVTTILSYSWFDSHSYLGFYDTQYVDRGVPDCRGRLRSDKDGKYGYRAVVPVPYPIPGDVSVSVERVRS